MSVDPSSTARPTVSRAPERLLRRLEWRVIRRLDGRLQGDYRTLLHGIGIDMAELRDYEPGDDVRHIDWNVTARMDSPYVRTYLEDRELTAWLLLDRSPSMAFGPTERSKEMVLIELSTTLARLFTRSGSRVGAILCNNAIERTIAPLGGRNQVLRLASHLLRPAVPTGTTTDLSVLLTAALGTIRRRSLVILVSDFMSEPGWERRLSQLSQRHELVAFQLLDRRELELPDAGVIVVEDAETGELLSVDTSDPEFRRRFHAVTAARQAGVLAAARQAGVDLYDLSTEDDLVQALVRVVELPAEAEARMTFIWPQMLGLLVVAPLAVVAYVALVRTRARRGAELAAHGFVPTAGSRPFRRLRHLPFALFLAALVLLLVAFARPELQARLPHREGTVILAFDVSNSMRAKDLEPTRMDAAKAAARTFVEKQPDSIRIGVVAFSDGGLVTQQPTSVRADVLASIDRLSPQGATSLGQGIFTSLNAIAGRAIGLDDAALAGNVDGVDVGYLGGAVVLLSDGENTSGPDPHDVAELASVAGVRVFPIGIGDPDGTVLEIDGFNVATALDEGALTDIADVTGGTYFHAEDAASLAQIYDGIDLRLTSEAEMMEVTGFITGISIVLLVIGGALSLVWFGRLV